MSDIYLSLTETPTVVTLSQPVVSGVLSSNVTVTNVVSVNVVTMPAITVQAAPPAVTTVAGTVAVSNFPASSSVTIGGFSTSSLPPSTVTVGNSVTIGNFPSTQTIAGTVTANLGNSNVLDVLNYYSVNYTEPFPVGIQGGEISGTVTARLQDASGNNLTSTSIGGVQRLNVSLASAATPGGTLPSFVNVYGGSDGSAVRTISVDSSGRQNTNAQFPRVTLIDGSGTVATANTAITVFASSSTRSYLLVQVTTGSAFVNVGATATTVNGINLTAGQGYSWETTIPQGIVSLISTTTSSRYVAKEA